ncbi:MAG TPA: AmmeMemoRadiSam system radical SAM enzyme [Planctomycetota bacterium]|nr:AmmeMemoRadiSam system radical SAM enzyme [Planctomycetota bacterium]
MFYDKRDDGKVDCHLCPHECRGIVEGKTGVCRVRRNVGGTLMSLVYGEVTSVNLDPIEKKPLYHFHPGSDILSIGTWGCNFHCAFCQNWQISQQETATESVTVDEIAALAGRDGSIGAAYTYNEPTIWYEFVLACAEALKERGLVNVLVTNGFINPGPAERWLAVIDALNIDIKSMDDAFYREQTGGRLQPVLDAAVQAKKHAHVEITNLVIPTLNDTDEDFRRLAKWMAEHLGRQTPLHLSAYFPRYRLKVGPTGAQTLERAREICAAELDYVYLGNVAGAEGHDTLCRSCGATLVSRTGYRVRRVHLKGPGCSRCGARSDLITGDAD